MDPHANITEQRELAQIILATIPTADPDYIYDNANRLAELVEALDNWRASGGFDPYANPCTYDGDTDACHPACETCHGGADYVKESMPIGWPRRIRPGTDN